MKIKAESTKPSNKKTPILCAFVLENSKEPLGLGKIHEKINSSVKESVKETKGKVGEISIIQTLGITPANKILIAGIGPKNKLSTDVLRNVTGKIAQKIRSLGLSEFSIVIPIGLTIENSDNPKLRIFCAIFPVTFLNTSVDSLFFGPIPAIKILFAGVIPRV